MKDRDFSIDFLRATAILLMTITHVNGLLYLGNNPILDIFTTAGATLCFSIFLFASAYVVGLRIQKGKEFTIKDTLKRVIEIYIVYIILGIFITFVLEKGINIEKVLNILVLNSVPEFTEFLIAFIIFSFLPLLLSKQIAKLMNKPLCLIALSIIIYILGDWAYQAISNISLPDIARIPIENILGYKSLHRFPFTFYLPIYSFGLLISKYRSQKTLLITTISSSLLLFLLLKSNLSHWYRWPPSPLFLMYSFVYIPVILLLYDRYKKFLSKSIFKLFTLIGRYPLEQFFLSTFLVFLFFLILEPTNSVYLPILVNISIFLALILHPIVFHRKMV